MSGVLQTEFEFTLPKGYADDDGELHREGVMRLATAADEIKPTKDPRVKSNPAYATVIILSRVVTELGTVDDVTPRVIENLFVSDLAYLQELYERVNERERDAVDATCPDCGASFTVAVDGDGAGGVDDGIGDNDGIGDGDLTGGTGNGDAPGATEGALETGTEADTHVETEPGGAVESPEGASTPEDR
jgi:hypothetical protein